jgi:hypothetical protein
MVESEFYLSTPSFCVNRTPMHAAHKQRAFTAASGNTVPEDVDDAVHLHWLLH